MFPKQETFKSTISTETGVGHLHLRTDEHSDDDEDEEVPGWACELYKNFANLRFLSLQPFRFAVKEMVVPGPHLKLFFPDSGVLVEGRVRRRRRIWSSGACAVAYELCQATCRCTALGLQTSVDTSCKRISTSVSPGEDISVTCSSIRSNGSLCRETEGEAGEPPLGCWDGNWYVTAYVFLLLFD